MGETYLEVCVCVYICVRPSVCPSVSRSHVTIHLPECFFVRVFLHLSLFHLHKWSESYVHFCPRPCLSTFRWARLATHRHIGPHSVCIPCPHAHLGGASLLWLAHEAAHGYFLGGSTSRRSVPFDTVQVRKPQSKKLAIIHPPTQLSFVRIAKRVFRPAGRHLQGTYHKQTHPPREYCEVHSTASEGVTPKIIIRTETERARVTEIR